jgi:hypothetical protein
LQVVLETVKDIACTPRHGLYDAQAIDSGFEKNSLKPPTTIRNSCACSSCLSST